MRIDSKCEGNQIYLIKIFFIIDFGYNNKLEKVCETIEYNKKKRGRKIFSSSLFFLLCDKIVSAKLFTKKSYSIRRSENHTNNKFIAHLNPNQRLIFRLYCLVN